MKNRFHLIWLCLLPLIVSISRLGGFIHESDQASIILGALRLSHGEASWISPGFYEYGNYFLCYWLLSGLFRLFPQADPVLLSNAFGLTLFWLGAGILLFSMRKRLSTGRVAAAFSVLSAPAVLVHLPYFAPNFISAGFLFAGAGLLNLRPRLFPVAAMLWAGAFGCRMDGLLLIPLLVWISADNPSVRELFLGRRSWVVAATGTAVFFFGKMLAGFSPSLSYAPFFIPKVYFAFLIFGAGSSLFLLSLAGGLLLRKGYSSPDLPERLFWWSALPALLIPILFYSAFMFSTRHWVVFLSGLLLFVFSRRTTELWNGGGIRYPVLLVASLAFLFVGLRLPFAARPALTVSSPTLFPTTDGRCPMGAVIPFLFSGQRLDHNQKIWEAARAVEYWEEVDGLVPLGSFQLFDIVRLAVTLNGQSANARGEDLAGSPFFYLTSRALLKPEVHLDTKQVVGAQSDLEGFSVEEVSGEFPMSILRVTVGADKTAPWPEIKKRIGFLRKIFQGDEVDWIGVLPAGSLSLPGRYEGHPILFFSEQPFTVTKSGEVLSAEYLTSTDSRGGFFYIHLPPVQNKNESISVSHSVWGCSTIYPSYMSLRNL